MMKLNKSLSTGATILISTVLLLLSHPPLRVYAAQTVIPVKIGDSIQTVSENDIGRGFKLNIKEGENPYKNHVFSGGIETGKKVDEKTHVRIVRDESEMKELLDISGSITVSLYGGSISGTGSGGYFSNAVVSKKQVRVFYRSRKLAFFKRLLLTDSDLTQDAQNLALSSPNEFAKKFGTKYVQEVGYGAQLDVSFTIRSSEEIDAEDILAELKGSIGKGKLTADFAAKFQMTRNETKTLYEMEIAAEATGALITVPANPTFNETIGIINDFNEEYQRKYENFDVNNQDLLKQIEPLQIILGNTKDRMEELNEMQLDVLENKMEDLGEVFLSSFVLKSQLDRINYELKETYENDPKLRVEMYNPYLLRLEEAVDNIDQKINDCLTFRSLPISQIVSGDVPEEYPVEASNDDNFIRGLRGEGYIEAPVKIGNYQPLEDIYYTGFTLMDEDGEMIPWMKGQLFDNRDRLIATADTPETLYELAAQYIKLPAGNLCHENTRIDELSECKVAGLSLGGCLGNDQRVSVVYWDNAPYGCFIKTNGPSVIYHNRNEKGKGGNGEFSALCKYNRGVYDSLSHTIVGARNKCPLGTTLTKQECKKAGRDIGGRLDNFEVLEGYWDDAPTGCFLTPADKNTIRYNKNMYGRGKIGVSSVCRKEPIQPEDFTMTKISKAPDGSSEGLCAIDANLDVDKCLEAGLAFGGTLRDGVLTEGEWTHAPPGCFLNPSEDNAIHYNTNSTAAEFSGGVYSALCLKPKILSYF